MLTARMRALGIKTGIFGQSFQNTSAGGSQPRIRVQLSPIGRRAQLLSAGGRSLRCRSHSNDSLSGSGGAEDDCQSNPLPDPHSGSGSMGDGEGRGETVRPATSTSGGLHPEMAEASSFGTLSESRMGSQMEMVLQLEAAKLRALEDYRQHLQLGDDDVDLLKGAVLIAKHRYPHLREEVVRARVDELAGAVRKRLPESAYPMRILQDISRVLYQQMGFAGNKDDYYNMDNSCINKVLEERKGIPISLSVVFMEVAARLGVPMAGVGLPFHFMIRPLLPEVEVLVDAFNGGEVCFLEDAEDRLSEISRMKIKLDTRFVRDAEPLSSRLVLYRMLTNIKQLYIAARRPKETLRIVRYMRATVSQPNDIRDEALCLYALDEHEECTQLLQEYLQEAPDANDAADVQQLIDRLKQL